MIRIQHLLAGGALLCLALNSASDEPYQIAVSKNVLIAMRDGVRLAADIYRPAQ